jgi:hypothetical protein
VKRGRSCGIQKAGPPALGQRGPVVLADSQPRHDRAGAHARPRGAMADSVYRSEISSKMNSVMTWWFNFTVERYFLPPMLSYSKVASCSAL